MAIDIQSLFNPGSLQQMAETEDEKKKRAQITGTMNFGGQSGTFNGNFDPSLLQQQNTSAPMGYQPPPNYGMSAPPEQPPVPVIQPPALPPPVGASPISGEYNIPDQQPVPLPPGNQPYVSPPSPLPPWVNETTTMANPFSQIPMGEQYNTYADYSQLPPSAQPPALVQPSVFERGPNYDGKDFGPSDLYGMPQPDQSQYVSIDGGMPVNPMSQIPMMENPQREEYNTMPSMEMTSDFAAYQNYFNQMYNPTTGSDQLPGQWAQLTPEQKAQYGATTPGPIAPGGMGLGQ